MSTEYAPPLHAPTAPRTSKLAVASMVLGIISLPATVILVGFVTAIIAVVLGHMGLSAAKNNPNLKGGGMALTGLILGYLCIALTVVFAAIAVPVFGAIRERAQVNKEILHARQVFLEVTKWNVTNPDNPPSLDDLEAGLALQRISLTDEEGRQRFVLGGSAAESIGANLRPVAVRAPCHFSENFEVLVYADGSAEMVDLRKR